MLRMHIICFKVAQKSSFYTSRFFFPCNFSSNITLALFFSLIWIALPFFSLRIRSKKGSRQWTRFYHFARLDNLLFYRHLTNEMHIFLLIFVATISNIKSQLASHTVIIHPREIFWKQQSGNVLINQSISFELFLDLRELFIVFNNKTIKQFQLHFGISASLFKTISLS